MDSLFRGLGGTVVRHRWKVVAAWVAFLMVGSIFAPQLHKVFMREFTSPSSGQAQRAADLVDREFRGSGAFQEQLVLSSSTHSVDDPRYRETAEKLVTRLQDVGLVPRANSFFNTGNRAFVSPDRKTTFAQLNLKVRTHLAGTQVAQDILDEVQAAPKPGWLTANVTGTEAVHSELTSAGQKAAQKAEAVGVPVAIVVLIVVFGALVAALLPLALGGLTIVISLALAYAVGQFMDLNVVLETIAVMFGLALGIDYSLFMLTRFRGERLAGRDIAAAVAETVTHAGKAIAFSGIAVLIGLSALLVTNEGVTVSLAIGGMLSTVVAVAGGLTLLPGVITLLGDRIERPQTVMRFLSRTQQGGFWHRWASRVIRRPVLYLVLGVAIIATLALPVLGLRLGSLGVTQLPKDFQSRRGYETLARKFGPGVASPVQFVIRSGSGIADPRILAGVDKLTRAIQADRRFVGAMSITTLVSGENVAGYRTLYRDGFARVPQKLRPPLSQMVNLQSDRDTTVIQAFLASDPQTPEAWATVRGVRNDLVPAVPELRGAEVLVGGSSALEADSVQALYARFPIVLAIILTATFLMLMVLLRSIVVPLKAVVMNLLSVAAAYGALVVFFQKGLGETAFDFTSMGAVSYMAPITLFAVLFGLSMDYEVFLLTRIREFHDSGYPNDEAVAQGLERTGKVITGAAGIMVVVFSSFLLGDILMIKELGFGLAVAVLVDATVIRVVLVPATMRLLGEWNWWLPERLARILPKVELEKEVSPQPKVALEQVVQHRIA